MPLGLFIIYYFDYLFIINAKLIFEDSFEATVAVIVITNRNCSESIIIITITIND